jgi:hypothetical protein
MSQIALSLGKLIHQTVTSDSMRVTTKRGSMPQFGRSEVLVCRGAGGAKAIHLLSKAQWHAAHQRHKRSVAPQK